ncbi:MAG: septum formation initiator family protein [Nitrospinae bacterium]|nr:septum formation initiator family protein [Nitrospinota bacterium]
MARIEELQNSADKNKEQNETNNKRLKIILFASLSFFIFLVLTAVFREDGIIKANRLNKKLELLKSDIGNLKRENEKLNREVYALKNDPSYIEKIAREDLGLVKPGEVVFEFVDKK